MHEYIGSFNFDIAHVTSYKMPIFFNQSQSKLHHHDSEIHNPSKYCKKVEVYKVFYIAHPIENFLVRYNTYYECLYAVKYLELVP